MPAANCEFCTRGDGERNMLRAVAALSVAVALSLVCTSNANAQLSAAADASTMPTSHVAVGADADFDAIKDLKASYFRNVDAKDWTALRELLAPDVLVDTRGSLGPVFHGRDAFVGFLKVTLGGLDTHHQGYDPHVTLTSATSAEVVWAMEDRLVFNDIIGVQGSGHYRDRYQKIGDAWVIDYSKLTRTGIGIVLPGLERFVVGLTETLRSRGPIAAIRFTVDAILHRNTATPAPTPAHDDRTETSETAVPVEQLPSPQQPVDKAPPPTDSSHTASTSRAAATTAFSEPRKARHHRFRERQALTDPPSGLEDAAVDEPGSPNRTTYLDRTNETDNDRNDRENDPGAIPEDDSRDGHDSTSGESTTTSSNP